MILSLDRLVSVVGKLIDMLGVGWCTESNNREIEVWDKET